MFKKVSNVANYVIRVSLTVLTISYLWLGDNPQAAMVTALLLIANEAADIADRLEK